MDESLPSQYPVRRVIIATFLALLFHSPLSSSAPADTTPDQTEATARNDTSGDNAPPASDTGASAESGQGSEKGIEIGGAVRFTYYWSGYNRASEDKRGSAGLDIFRFNLDGQLNGLTLSAEYRFYPYMNTIHHGWVGYDLSRGDQLQVGITRVPFGLLPYASHNFWFGIPYYLGLADDHDMGAKYLRKRGAADLQIGFFKNAELGDATNLNRYSYDPVVVAGAAANEEDNTIDARYAYTFGNGTDCTHELGVSGQLGQLYNRDTGRQGTVRAAAAHVDSRCGRWNLQLELVQYDHAALNPAGVSRDTVTYGAFAGSYPVASEGTVLVVNGAYNLPVSGQHIDLLTCYNDFSVLRKSPRGFDNSYLNTTGCLISDGPTFIYVDLINAHNMVFFDGGSLAGGGDAGIETRLNINLGYYW